jgi:hypothetical protein
MKKQLCLISLILVSLALGACSSMCDRGGDCVRTKDGSCAGMYK